LLQPNGDIIAYGANLNGSSHLFLARYTPTGSLDTTFGSGGLVETTTPGNNGNTGQAALQTNGQIVFVSGSWLFRYNSNGSLDTTFGSDGVVTLPSGFGTINGGNRTEPGLLIQPSNGDIVVGGYSGSDSALLAYTPSGTFDSTFGNGGEVLTPGGAFHALAIENGDIVAGGANELARYTLSGSLDATFGSSGIAAFPGTVKSLLVQPNGQIITVGNETVSNQLEWVLARYNVNGTLDTTFGSGGIVTSSPSGSYDVVRGAALESDGLIVVAGLAGEEESDFGVYNPNGSPDASFGSGGFVTTPWWSSPSYAGDGVLVQPNGDIVIASDNGSGIALARYLPPVAQTSPSFAVTGFPSPTTAGVAQTVTVTALNADGSVNTGYTGTVHFSSSDPQAVLPADYTFTAPDQGVHTFTVALKIAGSQSITVADTTSGMLGAESGITVNPAAASMLRVAGYPSPTNAGLAANFAVTALDPYGNVATGYTDTVQFSSSDPSASLPGNYTFTTADAGVHSSSATLNTAGTQSLTATDITTSSMTGTQANITVNPAGLPAARFSVTGFPSPTTAGTVETITVTARDANGTIAPSYRGTVHFSSSDPQAVLPANYTFTAADQGVHTFAVTLKTAGSQSITATDTATSSITGSESGLTITPAAAAQLILSGPSSVSSGAKFSLTLTVEDVYGNVVTGYRGTVHFTSSDPKATLPANYTFTAADAGVHTFSNAFILRKRGQQTITVTDTANSNLTDTDSINVT
jgi:uncharacterized delta-60 repeat protein